MVTQANNSATGPSFLSLKRYLNCSKLKGVHVGKVLSKAWDILRLDVSSRRGSQAACGGSTECVTRSSVRPEASVPVAESAAGRQLTARLLLGSYL